MFTLPSSKHEGELGEFKSVMQTGEQGWRSGESTRLQPMWSVFDSRSRWVEFVIGSLLAPRSFCLDTPVFPSPLKPTLPNSNSSRNARTHVEQAPKHS